MKDKVLYIILILLAMLVASCSIFTQTRTLSINIPVHMWEKTGRIDVWYTLKWTYGEEIHTLDIPYSVRTVSVTVPLGETTAICAFPFGNKQPCGAIVVPSDKKEVNLDQNSGVIASLIINCDRDVTSCLNYPALQSIIADAGCRDYRAINGAKLLADMLNGQLSETSIELYSPVCITFITGLDGTWIAESIYDSPVTIQGGMSQSIELLPGIHRYFSPVLSRIIEVAVESDGGYYTSPPVPFY